MPTSRLILFACPICGSAPGRPCRAPSGRRRASMHDSRPFAIIAAGLRVAPAGTERTAPTVKKSRQGA